MPRLSDTMEEGTVASWLKKVGDYVEEGDILAEIDDISLAMSSDKLIIFETFTFRFLPSKLNGWTTFQKLQPNCTLTKDTLCHPNYVTSEAVNYFTKILIDCHSSFCLQPFGGFVTMATIGIVANYMASDLL